ncbi:hypothetical protein JCM1840_006531 [Sporobolomyces johnsonii]
MPSTVDPQHIPLLNNPAEYWLWSIQAEAWFTVNDLLPYIDKSASRSAASRSAPEWASKNAKAKAYLIMMLVPRPTLLRLIQPVTNAAEAWDKVKARCEPEGALAAEMLEQTLNCTQLRANDDIAPFLAKFDKLVERLAALTGKFNEQSFGSKLLDALDYVDPRVTYFISIANRNKSNGQRALRYSDVTTYLRRIHDHESTWGSSSMTDRQYAHLAQRFLDRRS